MFTIAIPAYNNPDFTRASVVSAVRATSAVDLPCQFVLIDDAAGAGEAITAVFLEIRERHPEREFTIARSTARLFYPGAFSLALSLAETPLMMFMSNDMLLTPSYLMATLGVAALDPTFGCIRGSSGHTDGLPEHVVAAPPEVDRKSVV